MSNIIVCTFCEFMGLLKLPNVESGHFITLVPILTVYTVWGTFYTHEIPSSNVSNISRFGRISTE